MLQANFSRILMSVSVVDGFVLSRIPSPSQLQLICDACLLSLCNTGISQVTGFPPEHFSDFQINKHSEGSVHEAHLDVNPSNR